MTTSGPDGGAADRTPDRDAAALELWRGTRHCIFQSGLSAIEFDQIEAEFAPTAWSGSPELASVAILR